MKLIWKDNMMIWVGVRPNQIHKNVCACLFIFMACASIHLSRLPRKKSFVFNRHVWLNPDGFLGLNEEEEVKMRLRNKFSADKDELIAFFFCWGS